MSGTFSTLVDGYEGLINSESAGNLTPQALQDLLNQNPAGDSAAVGKLISSDKWYFAAVVTQEEGERLEQEGTLTLRFAGDFTQDISMKVEKVNQDGQGQAVVLSPATAIWSRPLCCAGRRRSSSSTAELVCGCPRALCAW